MTVRRIPTKRGDMPIQYVKVDLDGKAYTYRWTGVEPLKRGDRVEVPANVVNPKPSVRTVLRAMPGPDYDVDKIVNILAKVEGPDATERALDGLDRDEAKALREDHSMSRPEPHDWDDLIGYDPNITYESPDAYGERG